MAGSRSSRAEATDNVHIFGVRHHGPGSARSLARALAALEPDCVLIEGPPDADALLPLLADPAMVPPIALLIYVPDAPKQAVYYPFAVFSPEYQAARFALEHSIPVRWMDLPQAIQFATPTLPPEHADHNAEKPPETEEDQQPPGPEQRLLLNPGRDPLAVLAHAAGYADGERWWEQMVEQRRDDTDVFAAILEAMTALREEAGPPRSLNEQRREAWMRQTIRAALREGYTRIAVVCGAWHGPALRDIGNAKADAALLKNLPKTKTAATFAPWTYGRLSVTSGYGAGVTSPGYYEHLWHFPDEIAQRWLTRVARLLREQDLDAPAASVIEAVRLAEAVAALRERPVPGLDELNEAAQAVLCFGSETPMRLIQERLIVGNTLGSVPAHTPTTPLQADVQRAQKRLRMPPEPDAREYDLDLRKPLDLERSHLLHRLALLDLPWGTSQQSVGAKGTFHERWRLEWQPEFAVALIEASMWGTTTAEAATAVTRARAERAEALPAITSLVEKALLADLPDAVAALMRQLNDTAALTSDTGMLMDALPPLANTLRYGNVRQTDASAVAHVVDGLVARICIGFPGACVSLDDAAAETMFGRLVATHRALAIIRNPAHDATWQTALAQVANDEHVHGLIAGRCCRLLRDQGALDAAELALHLRRALSPGTTPQQAAAWIEGVLKGSGLLLIHQDTLWQIIDTWVAAIAPDAFQATLPLLRRTFATFSPPERRMIGERARSHEATSGATSTLHRHFDQARAEAALPLVAQLLGIGTTNTP